MVAILHCEKEKRKVKIITVFTRRVIAEQEKKKGSFYDKAIEKAEFLG